MKQGKFWTIKGKIIDILKVIAFIAILPLALIYLWSIRKDVERENQV